MKVVKACTCLATLWAHLFQQHQQTYRSNSLESPHLQIFGRAKLNVCNNICTWPLFDSFTSYTRVCTARLSFIILACTSYRSFGCLCQDAVLKQSVRLAISSLQRHMSAARYSSPLLASQCLRHAGMLKYTVACSVARRSNARINTTLTLSAFEPVQGVGCTTADRLACILQMPGSIHTHCISSQAAAAFKRVIRCVVCLSPCQCKVCASADGLAYWL